jgi:hypothetical protein
MKNHNRPFRIATNHTLISEHICFLWSFKWAKCHGAHVTSPHVAEGLQESQLVREALGLIQKRKDLD